MPTQELSILCVHGVGVHPEGGGWQDTWRDAIEGECRSWNPTLDLQCEFALYDDIFEQADFDWRDTVAALWKLLGSGLRRRRGLLGTTPERLRWLAGMVVQWVENDELRAELRDRILKRIKDTRPDVVCGHSLGSLICYDALSTPAGRNAIRNRTFISLGSQIGNRFVRDQFLAGRVAPLAAKKWFHLYNPEDAVFTAPISIDDPSFEQVLAEFDVPGMADHDVEEYLRHRNVSNRVWRELAAPDRFRAMAAGSRGVRALAKKPPRRALLVGINEYPNPADRLEGSVNDVFRISAVLQECGFDAEDIRIVLNRRATTDGILQRLHWLLDGTGPEDQRVFFYSGHGAQLPGYGVGERIDRLDECLVPHDFDGSPQRAVMDDQLYDLYSQLPYQSRLVILLDCCYSGGMARDGGLRARGIDPPDDIRHRMLKWDARHQMWVPRDFKPVNPTLAADLATRTAYAGRLGITRRLGRALELRTLESSKYDALRKKFKHRGPYLPLILQACQEDEYAFEYRHGATSYGAFTYCLTKILRRHATSRRDGISFADLIRQTTRQLHELQYTQTPAVLGPKALLTANVPWIGKSKKGRKR